MNDGLTVMIEQLVRMRSGIEDAILALERLKRMDVPDLSSNTPAVTKRRGARKATKAIVPAVNPSAPAGPVRKGGMTEDGRRRLAEAMKRRWAVKRAASAVKKSGRKKAA